MAMVTGFCSNGWHEGSKATDWRGHPAPTCRFINVCPCKCHADLDKMFSMTESERICLEVSGYSPPARTYWLPSDDYTPDDDVSSMVVGTDTGSGIEDVTTAHTPPSNGVVFAPTQSGRTAKGQLEYWVDEQCRIWLIDKPGFPCTPAWLSSHIAEDNGVSPPSVGAIDAVFKRWEALGYAVIDRKPTRFSAFTSEGQRLGLKRMKEIFKRQNRLRAADNKRNLRR